MKKVAMLLVAVLMLTVTSCAIGNGSPSNTADSTFQPGSDSTSVSESVSDSQPGEDDFVKIFDNLSYTTVIATPAGDVLPDGQKVDDNLRSRLFTKQTGLVPKVLWTASGDSFTQKMNMMIASGDIPDYFQVNYTQFEALVKANLLADLTELYNTKLNPEIKDVYATADNADIKAVTKDGKIYGLPKANGLGDSSPILWVRKDWMDALKLTEPSSIEDIAVIAKAFMEQDPDGNGQADTIGLPILPYYNAATGGTGSVADLFTNYGSAPGQWRKQDDGTIIYGSLMPQASETLMLLNSWFDEGLIPKDFGSWTPDMYKESITSGQAGLFFGPWWLSWSHLTDTVLNDPSTDWQAYALPMESGEDYISGAPNAAGGSIGVVSKDCEDPSIFIYALNDIYHAMQQPDYQTDIEEVAVISNSYTPMTIFPLPADAIINTGVLASKYAAGEITLDEVADMSFKSEASYNQMISTAAKVVKDSRTPYDSMEDWSNSVGYTIGMMSLYNGNTQFIRSEFSGSTDTMNKRKTFLDKYELESYTKMIMGDTNGMSIQDFFDEFVVSYLEQGGSDITSEIQAELGTN